MLAQGRGRIGGQFPRNVHLLIRAFFPESGLCSSTARWPLVPNFCSWVTRKTQFFIQIIYWELQIFQIQSTGGFHQFSLKIHLEHSLASATELELTLMRKGALSQTRGLRIYNIIIIIIFVVKPIHCIYTLKPIHFFMTLMKTCLTIFFLFSYVFHNLL